MAPVALLRLDVREPELGARLGRRPIHGASHARACFFGVGASLEWKTDVSPIVYRIPPATPNSFYCSERLQHFQELRVSSDVYSISTPRGPPCTVPSFSPLCGAHLRDVVLQVLEAAAGAALGEHDLRASREVPREVQPEPAAAGANLLPGRVR